MQQNLLEEIGELLADTESLREQSETEGLEESEIQIDDSAPEIEVRVEEGPELQGIEPEEEPEGAADPIPVPGGDVVLELLTQIRDASVRQVQLLERVLHTSMRLSQHLEEYFTTSRAELPAVEQEEQGSEDLAKDPATP